MKKVLCVSGDNLYEGTVYKKDGKTVTEVKPSKIDSKWLPKAYESIDYRAVDDGNGITITNGDMNLRLDYSAVHELRILLNLASNDGYEMSVPGAKRTGCKFVEIVEKGEIKG